MEDSQQKAVYAWENQWGSWSNATASQRDVRRVIRAAERWYRIPPALIEFRKRRKDAAGALMPSVYHAAGGIVLRPDHVNIPVALHETAHAVMNHLFGWEPRGMEDHGPQWLGIYMCLLARFKVAPRVALESSAAAMGLEWVGPGWVGPTKIRRRYRGAVRRALAFWES